MALEELEPAYEALAEATDIDVRASSGDSENLAPEFARCFLDKPPLDFSTSKDFLVFRKAELLECGRKLEAT